MNEGTISECGTYDELMLHNGPFAQFLLQYLQNEATEDCDDPESKNLLLFQIHTRSPFTCG